MLKVTCEKCESETPGYYTKKVGNQVGAYCSECGAWIKWLSKKEQEQHMRDLKALQKLPSSTQGINKAAAEAYAMMSPSSIQILDMIEKSGVKCKHYSCNSCAFYQQKSDRAMECLERQEEAIATFVKEIKERFHV